MIKDLWYKNAVIYCLDVATFMDANGDGIGDFLGLTRRLDYLEGLGVDAVWLTPFMKSPRRDHGYDVADYYSVDPCFGSLGDFVEFTKGAAQRGLRVMIDLVVNHTSNEHPWFQSARKDPGSPYRDWYIWSAKKPPDANKGMAFPGVQEATWSYDKVARAWYHHRFYEFQPELNTDNPHVQAEIFKIIGFWLQLGVTGFRLDAAPFFIGPNGASDDGEEDFELLRRMREFVQWRSAEAIILGEANITPDKNIAYFGPNAERMQMMFNFPVNQALFYALASADTGLLAEALAATRPKPHNAQWAQFLRNHDELDLGRLPKAKREQVFAAFAPDEDMQLYRRGIRRRLAPMLKGDRQLLELAYSLLFTLPGAPVLRYGDEIGMGDQLALPEREAVRTPMQWSDEPNAGFSRAGTLVKPMIADGPYGYAHINVAEQRRDPNAFVNWLERIIRMRKEVPEVGWGDPSVLDVGDRAVLALRYDWLGNGVLFLHNFSAEPLEVLVDLRGDERADLLVNLLGDDHSRAEDRRHPLRLERYGYRWFRIGGLDYLLRRREV